VLRDFLGLAITEAPPEHSTISLTRRLTDLETHQAVFTWVLQKITDAGLVKGKTIGIDATTLEVNAALRSIVRCNTGDRYQEFLTKLAKKSGVETQGRVFSFFSTLYHKFKSLLDDVWTFDSILSVFQLRFLQIRLLADL
jgi:hypothetical protein